MTDYDLIVVGAGLAGMASTLAASDAALALGVVLRILLIDKQSSLGGNSAKASSGMNAAVTPAQVAMEIPDTIKNFYEDSISSGDGLNDARLVSILTDESESAWRFLRGYGVNLDKVTQCGGHSFARTHRQKDSVQEKPTNVGFYITSTLQKHIGERTGVNIMKGAKVTSLLSDGVKVIGVRYQTSSSEEFEVKSTSVVLATGGYGGDFSEDGFLKQYHEMAWTLASTNGGFANGDGIRLARSLGAGLIHMDKVQIHPTSFIDPKNPFDKTKFLAAEALRGEGGILVNSEGRRFVNELGRRDHVTHAIFANCAKETDEEKHSSQYFSYLVLNEQAKTSFGSGFGFYMFKGFFKKYSDASEFTSECNLNYADFRQTLESYEKSSLKSLDEFGKHVFPTIIKPDETLYVAKITPAVHYTMGGLTMSTKTEILAENGQPISGLYGAGEVTGGVHGENRLGGNSLLECVVFGRRAGAAAAEQVLKI